jgi:hypothetical protein
MIGTALLLCYAGALGMVSLSIGRLYESNAEFYQEVYEWTAMAIYGTFVLGVIGLLIAAARWLWGFLG